MTCRYFNSFIEDDSIHIVMEFAEQGDLYRVNYFGTDSIDVEGLEDPEEVLFRKGHMGLRLPDMPGGGVSAC